ncbi:hypothetical protein B0H15DRAFT_954637 [Mycena belliarum]|uniref:Uncharacterized protein n=1 Tax=Mycena belliarum TaxID=1033014 RepID=A0AAD6XP97_9AGAR|nr:hypothetical protein B0H15DRAFT_954637 [Mycena belliae]
MPLPADFDIKAYLTVPHDVPAPFGFDLQDKNAENVRIQKDNKLSMSLTRAYGAARDSAAGIGELDVGLPLLPYYEYSDVEKARLVASAHMITQTGPLPLHLSEWITDRHIETEAAETAEKAKRKKERADKETEKSKATRPIFGTQRLKNPHLVSSSIAPAPTIPDLFHMSLHQKHYFPLHWWTDKIVRQAVELPHTIPSELVTAAQTSELVALGSVRVVSVAKAMKTLGEDDISYLTPGLWRQASVNLLQSLKKLCVAVDSNDPLSPSATHATEYEKHVRFFANLPDFEDLSKFPVWYPIEVLLRYKILGDALFDRPHYETRVGVAFSTHEHMQLLGLAPAARLGAPPGLKRAADEAGAGPPNKAPTVSFSFVVLPKLNGNG